MEKSKPKEDDSARKFDDGEGDSTAEDAAYMVKP